MLRHRLLFGTLMIVLLLLTLWVDGRIDRIDLSQTLIGDMFLGRQHPPGGLLVLVLALVLAALAGQELHKFFQAKGADISRTMTAVSGIAGLLLMYSAPANMSAQETAALFGTVMILVFLLSLLKHCWGGVVEGALNAGGAAVFAFVYLGSLPGFYLMLRRWNSPWLLVALILICKSCDIGAYFTGRAIGKHKLIPWLSPGKTWEGLIGGLVTSSLLAVGLTALANYAPLDPPPLTRGPDPATLQFPVPIWYAALAGLLIGGVGQLGDLTASLLKRDAGLKDSGDSIPGFGGLLDVLDSPIVVAPLAYWLVRLAPVG